MKLGERIKNAVAAFRSGDPSARLSNLDGWDAADNWSGTDYALSLSTVYACVKIISETVGLLPLNEFLLSGDDRALAKDRREYRLLKIRPNKYQSPFAFKQLMTAYVVLWGRAYAERELALDNSTVLALHPIHPSRCQTKLDSTGTQLVHLVDGREMTSREILYLPGPSFDGVHPKSVLSYARETIKATGAATEFSGRFFENDARPGGVLKYPGKFTGSDDPRYKRLKADWEATHRGAAKRGNVAILEDGMDFLEIGMPLEDAQFLQTRKFNIAEVARFFRMPLHKLQELDKATFSNIEHQSLEFVTDTMMPWFTIWEESCNCQLVSEKEMGNLFFKFNVNALLRGDLKSRYEAYGTGRQWGWLTVNDILRLEDQNGIGPEGDKRLTPLNMDPLSAKKDGGKQ